MRYASVCSGIEAASVAWHPLGWEPAWFAEIDPFASAVLAHRFPGVPNRGDFTQVEVSPGPDDVVLLVGGTPCQSFSVAGKRLGLDDPRGNLALEFLRLARRLRPRWVVFENVPGLLSSGGGRDFGAFLGAMGECGYGYAYRILDAKFFGVPQRRRRVFVVGHLGDWARPAAVLLEPESLCGDPAAGGEAGEVVAGTLGSSSAGRGWNNDLDRSGAFIPVASVVRTLTSHHGRFDGDTDTFIAHTLRADGFDASEDGTGRGTPLVPVAYQCGGSNVGPMGTVRSGNGHLTGGTPFIVNAAESCAKQSHARESDVARCFDSTGSFAGAQGGTVVSQPISLVERGREGGRNLELTEDLAPALKCNSGGAVGHQFSVFAHSAVRRLTPVECERLQGFPDDWTLIPWRGKPAEECPDGPRYRAIGNSMAVPVMRWIGGRIAMVEAMP